MNLETGERIKVTLKFDKQQSSKYKEYNIIRSKKILVKNDFIKYCNPNELCVLKIEVSLAQNNETHFRILLQNTVKNPYYVDNNKLYTGLLLPHEKPYLYTEIAYNSIVEISSSLTIGGGLIQYSTIERDEFNTLWNNIEKIENKTMTYIDYYLGNEKIELKEDKCKDGCIILLKIHSNITVKKKKN